MNAFPAPGDHVLLHYARATRWPFEGQAATVEESHVGPAASTTVRLSNGDRLTVPPELCVPLLNRQSPIPAAPEAQP